MVEDGQPKHPANDDGPWRGPTEAEWLHRIAHPSTPVNETLPWIKGPEAHFELREPGSALLERILASQGDSQGPDGTVTEE